MNPLWFFIPTIVGMLGCQMVDGRTNNALKHALWGMFTVCEGLALAPLITMAGAPIVFNAAAATAVMVGGLSLYAYTTPT